MTNLEQILAITGLVFVAMITPGPNNFIVMSRAARLGPRSAAASAFGVLLGTQILLTVIWFGAEIVFDQAPYLQPVIKTCGAAFLALLGVQMIWRARTNRSAVPALPVTRISDGILGLAIFQFLNPKSWVLVLAAVAAVSDFDAAFTGLVLLAGIFILISSLCLLAWGLSGAWVFGWLQTSDKQSWFDGVLGFLLVMSGVTLVIS